MKTIWANLDEDGFWTIETETKNIKLTEEEFRRLQALQENTIWVCFVPTNEIQETIQKDKSNPMQ